MPSQMCPEVCLLHDYKSSQVNHEVNPPQSHCKAASFPAHGIQISESNGLYPSLLAHQFLNLCPTLMPKSEGPIEYILFCVSALDLYPAPVYNGDIDWPLTRPRKTDFAIIMNERCQPWNISLQIFLYIVDTDFCKDWAPSSLQS